MSNLASDNSNLIFGVTPYAGSADEEYMNDAQVTHFKLILNNWKDELSGGLVKTRHTIADETANHPDPTDRASQETDMSLELRSRDRERKLIKKINESLADIDSGDYGYCENCGVDIGIRRLEARPTASLCVDCKTLDEIRERQKV